MLIFLFSAWACAAVGRTAQEVVNEVRRQFIERPGIMVSICAFNIVCFVFWCCVYVELFKMFITGLQGETRLWSLRCNCGICIFEGDDKTRCFGYYITYSGWYVIYLTFNFLPFIGIYYESLLIVVILVMMIDIVIATHYQGYLYYNNYFIIVYGKMVTKQWKIYANHI